MTLIVGRNNCGKTSLLEALALLANRRTSQIGPLLNARRQLDTQRVADLDVLFNNPTKPLTIQASDVSGMTRVVTITRVTEKQSTFITPKTNAAITPEPRYRLEQTFHDYPPNAPKAFGTLDFTEEPGGDEWLLRFHTAPTATQTLTEPAFALVSAQRFDFSTSFLVEVILERDIRQRLRQRSVRPIRIVADYLLSVVPTVLNSSALGARLELGRAPNTVKTYIDHLRRAYLLIDIHKWSRKAHLRIRNEKLYPVDVALMGGGRQANPGENVGWRLETVVLIELLRRHRPFNDEVFYYQENRSEADFVVCHGNNTLAVVQVSADISKPKTRERELRGAIAAAKATGCPEATLVTLHESGEETIDGIRVRIVRARDWLCTPPQ